MLMIVNGFCKTRCKEGRKFSMGVNEITLTRVPWNLVTLKKKECRVEKSAHSVTEYTIGSIVYATWHGLLSQHVALLSRCVRVCVCVCFWVKAFAMRKATHTRHSPHISDSFPEAVLVTSKTLTSAWECSFPGAGQDIVNVYCLQVGPTQCTYLHSEALIRHVAVTATTIITAENNRPKPTPLLVGDYLVVLTPHISRPSSPQSLLHNTVTSNESFRVLTAINFYYDRQGYGAVRSARRFQTFQRDTLSLFLAYSRWRKYVSSKQSTRCHLHTTDHNMNAIAYFKYPRKITLIISTTNQNRLKFCSSKFLQLVKKSSVFYGTGRIITVFRKVSNCSLSKPEETSLHLPTLFLKTYLNIFLTSNPRFSMHFLSF
jgi:hypothetical protein